MPKSMLQRVENADYKEQQCIIMTTELLPSVVSTTPIRSDLFTLPEGVLRVNEYIQFVEWFALPSMQRDPKTQQEFASLVGVSQDTLTDWKKLPEFRATVGFILREWVWERTPDVIGSLYYKVASGRCSAGDVKLFLEIAKRGFSA